MKIAIIGSGISGLASAYWLNADHDIVVYESEARIGGHTATVDVSLDGRQYAVDTGFIVFNDWTYPEFIKLINDLGVESQPTEMSFSVSDRINDFEYSGTNLNTLLAQRRNLIRRRFWRMLSEINRFNKQAKADFANNQIDPGMTMGEYLDVGNYDQVFKQYYILPMASAIWSMPRKTINDFQALFFIRFFNHHGLLNVTNRPQWHVIKGGSREYLSPLTKLFSDKIRTSCAVTSIKRKANEVLIQSRHGQEKFDAVIFACHSDQALKILANEATDNEIDTLGAIDYCASDVTLHTDTDMLPNKRRAWASWNYLLAGDDNDIPLVTYNMNILQGINSHHTFCVSLNAKDQISPDKVIHNFRYAHPELNAESIRAQQRWNQINGENRSWFCGAYWGNGFHEDGVASARRIVDSIKSQSCRNILTTAA